MNTNQKKFLVHLHVKQHCLTNKRPKFLVKLNNIIQLDHELKNNNELFFTLYANFGGNNLSIEFLNKNSNDTVINNDHSIKEDLALEIIELDIGNINFTDIIKQHNIYRCEDGAIEQTYGYMHKNGIINFNFDCPPFYALRNLTLINHQQAANEIITV